MSEFNPVERKYAVPSTLSEPAGRMRTTEDLHAWSIYRQNLNSEFTDSALGTGDKSRRPFGNFQLEETTVQTILNHPKYGPRERKSELGSNAQTYLRFGLPRVHPHRLHRDGSSGYDSSEDGSPQMNRRRVRSDPDFRQHIIQKDPRPMVETSFGQSEKRLKASSEADLLRTDKSSKDLSESRAERSYAGSHASLLSRGSGPDGKSDAKINTFYSQNILNAKYFPKDNIYSASSEFEINGIRHPHLQVRDLYYEEDKSSTWHTLCGGARTKLRLLDRLSFEVKSGEILAVLAASEREGTALLDVLSNRHRKWRCRLRGDIVLNGLYMPPSKLERCVAYVPRHLDLTPDMSVRQTLLFTSLLQQSDSTRNFDTKGRINALLEDLGLVEVKHTRVKDLTESEKRRVSIACQLLLDTDIILLDQSTKGMDIFDTFFLVEYLRQWAARGRIVIMTMHPPTYEIFTMISRVLLLSTGRALYFGNRKDMLPYFSCIEFPCPAFKNPSDYYLDLVTLDNLSAEAMLESSQRIENLVDMYHRNQEPLIDPGPPGMPPPTVKRAHFFMQILALWIRVLIYMFPYNIIYFFRDVLLSALMSVFIGAIFWNVRSSFLQENVQDRLGFYYVLMGICLWPLILNITTAVWQEKVFIHCDISRNLYWKISYVMSKLMYSFPSSVAILLAYVVPAYSMAGLGFQSRANHFGIYIGYMLLYLLTIRMLAMALGWTFSSRHYSAFFTGTLFLIIITCAGYAVHINSLSVIFSWFQWVSPARWMMEQLVINEFSNNKTTYSCPRNPAVEIPNIPDIRQQASCGIRKDNDMITYLDYNKSWPSYQPIVLTIVFHFVFFVFGFIMYLCTSQKPKSKKRN